MKITFLTNPVGQITFRSFCIYLYNLRYKVRTNGPSTLIKNLSSGLRKNKIYYNFNPRKIDQLEKNVVVLSNPEALKQTLELKKMGVIKTLVCGPNMFIRPKEDLVLFTDRNIDIMLVPSKWVADGYIEDAPSLKEKICVWPAGIDTGYWFPQSKQKDIVLFFYKNGDQVLLNQCINYLKLNGIQTNLIEYGHFNQIKYKNLLQKSTFLVYFSESESQGMALLEAWSMGVPTLVWDRGYAITHKGSKLEKRWVASSAPYLTKATGIRFRNYGQFIKAYKEINKRKYGPREWVLKNMTDKICAGKLSKIISAH